MKKGKKVEKQVRAKKPPKTKPEVEVQGVAVVDMAALFASTAMNGLVAGAGDEDKPEDIVAMAWQLADLMMVEARKRANTDKDLVPPPLKGEA